MRKEEVIHKRNELLIVSLTPQNLERDVLWYLENLQSIKRARSTNPWWRDNSLILEKDLVIKPSVLLRQLSEMGYERAQTVRGRGLLGVRGGIVEVWPINTEKPWLVEFVGNKIETLRERESVAIEAKHPYYRGLASIEKLPPGSYVVHADHGIGIYRGLTRTEKQARSDAESNITSNYYIIEYAPPRNGAEPDRLYVPVDKKDRLTPYVGFETPTVHRLGGTFWHNTKKKVSEDVAKLAKDLLELYARRETAERPVSAGDEALLDELRSSFPYQETEDQIRAEKEIINDFSRAKPMDRILCGDVGFGKTEVALRSAFYAISSGKQAAVLAPTTILVAQHEKTFRERISNQLPVTISMLSRLTTPSEEKKILRDLESGRLDCVIGTHRLLGKDIKFKNLGLVIIDEEQRFGVKHKEHFKTLRSEVDILSLSATPIPRTLSLALAKLRDITVIETPPPDRLPIQTFALPYSAKIIRRAIQRELKRGGQVYFLHNRIETIAAAKEKLQKQLLQCRYDRNDTVVSPRTRPTIGIIHGRMKEKELIRVMDEFRRKEIDILLATTIIENGLDISSANTLIVDDATRLGLAQAHQLRGRIGRSAEQAYAYFLYPVRSQTPKASAGAHAHRTSNGVSRPRHLSEKAAERLAALEEYSQLGSGYQIALRDLELRGAGNILGKKQSGAINKVGFNLYCQMLSEAVEQIRN